MVSVLSPDLPTSLTSLYTTVFVSDLETWRSTLLVMQFPAGNPSFPTDVNVTAESTCVWGFIVDLQ